MIISTITGAFEDEYLVDLDDGRVDGGPLRVRGLKPSLALCLDGRDATIAVNLLPLLLGQPAGARPGAGPGRHALSTLSSTFQLLRVCEAAVSETGDDLGAVDAVLGCPLLLFEKGVVEDRENFESLPSETREAACLALFYVVDWLRELVNAFCNQAVTEMRSKVLLRLRQLLWMERLLDRCLGLTPRFRLPTSIVGEAAAPPRPASKAALSARAPAAAGGVENKAPSSKPSGKAAAKGKGKGKAAVKAAPKRRRGSDVDSSDDEGEVGADVELGTARDADAAILGDEDDVDEDDGGGGGAGSSIAKSKAKPKAERKPQPGAALPPLPHLAAVAPYLRSLSLDASCLLTSESISRKELDTAGITEAFDEIGLTPPSIHYLAHHLHTALKSSLGAPKDEGGARPGFGGARAAATKKCGGTGHDLSALELRRLSAAGLMNRLRPTLLTFRPHIAALGATIPAELPRDPELADADSAFGEPEDERLASRFVEPALLSFMGCLRVLLDSKQLSEPASQEALYELLLSFDATRAAAAAPASGSPATPGSPGHAATACIAAFDFFDALFPSLPSLALQAELVALERSLIETLGRLAPSGCDELAERRLRLSALALACVQRERPDDREYKVWKDKPPSAAHVKDLFLVQATYCGSPRELLREWTEDYLPTLCEDAPAADAELELEAYPLFSRGSAPHFISVLFQSVVSEMKRLPFPEPPKPERSTKAGGGAGWARGAKEAAVEEARGLVEELDGLVRAFVQLVLSTRLVDSKALAVTAIRSSATFLAAFNKRGLPMMSEHFEPLTAQVIGLLKALQPATRLLQVHCTMVKERQQIGALRPAALLKKELEILIFAVKVLLQEHGVSSGFWMGNLKHKNVAGEEVSSQMVRVEKVVKEKAEKKQATKKRKVQAEPQVAEMDCDEDEEEEAAEQDDEGCAMHSDVDSD